MMSRPVVLVFLLVVLIITSQFEWKQQLMNEIEMSPNISQKQQHVLSREEVVKEKIILSQERNIQRLHDLIQSLQLQLLQCRGGNNTTINDTDSSSIADLNEIERHQILN